MAKTQNLRHIVKQRCLRKSERKHKHTTTICPFLQSRQILSAQIKYYPVNGLSLFILENSLRLPQNRIENQILMNSILGSACGPRSRGWEPLHQVTFVKLSPKLLQLKIFSQILISVQRNYANYVENDGNYVQLFF